ncbi:regulatory protein [Streptomyces sp. SPB074]|nr:regulatory protein [Streptomyces sp. SPB074]
MRALRKSAGLTVTELGAACGWHHAKTSRIENARTAPSVKDITVWCRASGAESLTADLEAQSLNAESMYSEWRDQMRGGMKRLQESLTDFYRETRLFRVYSSTLIPGLLRTEGYAAGLLTAIAGFRQIPVKEGAEAAAARVARSRAIHEPGHRFVFLVEEAALRYRIGDDEAMAAQLGFLLTAGALPSVSLGIVPASRSHRRQWPHETFHVYDDALISIELLSAGEVDAAGRGRLVREGVRRAAPHGRVRRRGPGPGGACDRGAGVARGVPEARIGIQWGAKLWQLPKRKGRLNA